MRTKAIIINWLRQYKKDGINGLQPKKGKHCLLKQPKQIDLEQAKIDKSKTQDELLKKGLKDYSVIMILIRLNISIMFK